MISFKDTRTILFDLDDTLVHCSPRIHLYFLRRFIQALYPRLSPWRTAKVLYQVRQSATGLNNLSNRERLIATFSHHSNLSLSDCEQLYDKVVMEILSGSEPYFRPIEQAQHFIQNAASRLTLVLATNPLWPEDFARLRLKWGGLSAVHFHLITHAQNMCHTKPHAAYFSELLAKLNRDAETCLFIGNSLRNDAPAATLGIPTVIVGLCGNDRVLRARREGCAPLVAMSWQSLSSSLEKV
jgi:FMN phosphatase YigB (HAD superfamily)